MFAAQLEGAIPVPTSGRWLITTVNTVYTWDADRGIMSGGHCGIGKRARIDGATFGGSMIAIDRLYLDAHMEFVYWDELDQGHVQTTSAVQSITPEAPDANEG
jgi:hypothetical protein